MKMEVIMYAMMQAKGHTVMLNSPHVARNRRRKLVVSTEQQRNNQPQSEVKSVQGGKTINK